MLQIVKIGFENLIVSSYLNVKTVQCILLTWDSEIIPWTNDPEEKLQNHPSCTSIRSLSILIWRMKELSGSLSMGRTRWICWTRRSLNASFPIRLWRNVFMVHRYWNVNYDLAASLYTSPRYTAYCSFFITICISLHRTVTGQDRGLCGGSGSAVCDVLCRLLSNPKVSNTRPARRNSETDAAIIVWKLSRTTRRRTTFSVGADSWDSSWKSPWSSSCRALPIKTKGFAYVRQCNISLVLLCESELLKSNSRCFENEKIKIDQLSIIE